MEVLGMKDLLVLREHQENKVVEALRVGVVSREIMEGPENLEKRESLEYRASRGGLDQLETMAGMVPKVIWVALVVLVQLDNQDWLVTLVCKVLLGSMVLQAQVVGQGTPEAQAEMAELGVG